MTPPHGSVEIARFAWKSGEAHRVSALESEGHLDAFVYDARGRRVAKALCSVHPERQPLSARESMS